MKPTAEELLDVARQIDAYDKSDTRWGYSEVQVFEHEGRYYAVEVLVTAGDEGGIEALEEPVEVEKVEVMKHEWRPTE